MNDTRKKRNGRGWTDPYPIAPELGDHIIRRRTDIRELYDELRELQANANIDDDTASNDVLFMRDGRAQAYAHAAERLRSFFGLCSHHCGYEPPDDGIGPGHCYNCGEPAPIKRR